MLKKLFLSGTAAVAALLLVVAAPMAANASELPPPPQEEVAVAEVVPDVVPTESDELIGEEPVADAVTDDVAPANPVSNDTDTESTPDVEEATDDQSEGASPEAEPETPNPEGPVGPGGMADPYVANFTAVGGVDQISVDIQYFAHEAGTRTIRVVFDGDVLGVLVLNPGNGDVSQTFSVQGPRSGLIGVERLVSAPNQWALTEAPVLSVDVSTEIQYVSPAAPVIDEVQQSIFIEDDPNFSYALESGEPLEFGVNVLGPIGSNAVIATPNPGVVVDPNATTQWPFEFSAPQPPVFVTPPAPTQVGNEVIIPSEEGVVYQVDGGDIVAGGPFTLTKDVCITALPDGVTFPDKAQTNWCFEYQEPYVPIVVEPTNPLAGAVACSDYDIPEIDGVIYGDPVVTRVGTLLTITITATPDAGFAFDGEQIRVFSVTLDVAECEGTPPITPGPVQPPVPPVDNAGPIVPPILAGENQPVSDKNTDTLAVTGAGDAGGTLLAAVALLALGGALMVRRRRQSA